MILPIVAFGAPILRENCKDITSQYPDLNDLLANMWETMYNANGVGLAAPQINKAIRLFIVDTTPFIDEEGEELQLEPVKKVFINARIIEEKGEEWDFNEGCLSVPEIREDIFGFEIAKSRSSSFGGSAAITILRFTFPLI